MRISDWSSDVGSSDLPVFSVFQAALAVKSASEPDERRAAFAELRALHGDKLGAGIEADGFLERIRIAYAANFSLYAKTDHGHFVFDPVFFSRHVGAPTDGDFVNAKSAAHRVGTEGVSRWESRRQ